MYFSVNKIKTCRLSNDCNTFYESFVLIGVILFEKIVYSNKATVEDETEKKDEENKKKKD